MNPLISVIVPIYNAEKYLSDCIQSILNQTYHNIQVILINDGSTDKSLEICNAFKAIDERVIVIDKQNSGVSATRNYGLEVATGDYIGFVDSDDYIEKNMYEVLLNRIINDNSDLCVMTAYTINNLNEEVVNNRETLDNLEALKYLLLLEFPTSLWACLYSKKSLETITLNKEIHFFEDFEFNFQVLLKSNSVSLSDKRLYNYRINDSSANSQSINDKRMTCLNIYDYILPRIDEVNSEYLKYATYFRAHCIMTIIASISKSRKVNDEYYRVASLNAKQIMKAALISKHVPFSYKASILAFSILPKIFTGLLYHFKYR